MAKNKGIPFEEVAKKWRVKKGYSKAYAALDEEYAMYEAMLKAMQSAKITQKEVAKRMHTSEAAVSRLFDIKKKHKPSWTTIMKFAHALGKRPVLKFVDA